LAIYKLIKTETEAYIAPSSLLWEFPGTHFISGSMNRLDYFDVNRPGSDGPFLTIPTGPSKRSRSKGCSIGMKGHISALASTIPDEHGCSIVAAGTRTRWIGMYDIHRTEKAIANWSISGTDGLSPDMDTGGRGVVQLVWSPCGRYLVVNERRAGGLLVYDIRGSGKLLGVLGGRTLNTQQRLTCDVFAGDQYHSNSFEVWAGAEDGTVLVWDHVGKDEGLTPSSWEWKAHSSPVGSTALHSSGSVVATCSGGWAYPGEISENDEPNAKVLEESSLKLWGISSVDAGG
jgi:WD40 repeat protein